MQVENWLSRDEFQREGQSRLGDWRRTQREVFCMKRLAESPSASFPEAFKAHKELEGFYRFVENPKVKWRGVMSAHQERTVERVHESEEVLIVHDTTDVRFPLRELSPMRSDLGLFSTATQGFYVHASLAVANTPQALPLGTLRVQPFIHKKEAPDAETMAFWEAESGFLDNERQRWFTAVDETNAMVASETCSPIHVMDREADSYPMLAWLQHEEYRFVIRACHLNRMVEVEGALISLSHALDGEPFVAQATVPLSSRKPLRNAAKKAHPAREGRIATLSFRAASVTFRLGREKSWSPTQRKDLSKTIPVNVVEAVELNPPAGVKAVRWLLLTSEAIDTPEPIVKVVDVYKKRWTIEEFFKSLKTGCKLEARQMESASTILNVLALLLPQAWRVLLLRSLSDQSPDEPWHSVMEPLVFELLKLKVPEAKLNNTSTVCDVMLAVASLGGHIRYNGPPGWITLHRGWRKLADLAQGARLMLKLQHRKPGAVLTA